MYCKYFYPNVPYFCPMMNMHSKDTPCNFRDEMTRTNFSNTESFHIKFKKINIEELIE